MWGGQHGDCSHHAPSCGSANINRERDNDNRRTTTVMRWDLTTYLDTDQQAVEDFLAQTRVDVTSFDGGPGGEKLVASTSIPADILLRQQTAWPPEILFLVFQQKHSTIGCQIGNFSQTLKVSGISDSPENLFYIKGLVRDDATARQAASDIRKYFADIDYDVDDVVKIGLVDFADWLASSAKYCKVYKFSYGY
eukprot:jgi/Chlat1/9003/Chrsp94S08342